MKEHAFSEIFYSIQGEGEYTGVPTAWLRFFLCNLQCNGFGQKDPTDESTYVLPYKDFDPTSVNRIEDLPVWSHGCDSSYSWSSKFKHLQYKKTAAEICDQIQAELTNEWNPTGTFHHPLSHVEQHMCFTGGEPLMKHGQQAVVEIIDERGEGPVELRAQHVTDAAGVVRMGVPQRASRDLGLALAWPVHLHQTGAGLDQTPGQQGALTELVLTIGTPQCR